MTARRAGLLLLCAAAAAPAAPGQNATYEQLQVFSNVVAQVRLQYVDSVTTPQLIRGAIRGMLAGLDPHSSFVTRAEALRFLAWEEGRLASTGIAVEMVDGAITVLGVYPGGPAARAGVRPGDRLLTFNDTTTAGMDVRAVQSRLVGEEGGRVSLRVERGPRLEPESITVRLRNEELRPLSVAVSRTLPGGVAYVQLLGFHPETARELRDAIRAATPRGGPRRIILDLRGNGGGLVASAVEVASLFLPRDRIVYTSRGRRPDANAEARTDADGEFRDATVVVLVDGATASAAELVAGALQDHDRALVAGRRTFGKALMQRMFEVPPAGDVVWLTVGYLYTPSGRMIQRRYAGLTPEQYRAGAGGPGTGADTADTRRTDAGRVVRGGGGIRPDTVLAEATRLPLWWLVASDSAFLEAVADSLAQSLSGSPEARDQWAAAPTQWRTRLLPPLLDRVRRRMAVRAEPDSEQMDAMALWMAERVAAVRWGQAAEADLALRYDSDVTAAVALSPRVTGLLRSGTPAP